MDRSRGNRCAPLALLAICAACDGGGGHETDDLIDRLFELDDAQKMFECGCPEPPLSCMRVTDPILVECYKSVAPGHADAITPELKCGIRALEATNACFRMTDCADTAAWQACFDAGEDCDERATESYEEDVEVCWISRHQAMADGGTDTSD